MSAWRLAVFALATMWPWMAGAQLVVRDAQGPALPNPADSVPYPRGGSNCNDTIADTGARALLRAIDACPNEFYKSRQAYASYTKTFVLGFWAVPGAPQAAVLMAGEKAAENAFFCLTESLVDESGASDEDKAFVKALVKTAKENIDRADFAKSLLELKDGVKARGLFPFLNETDPNTFVQTLDASLKERYEGVFGDGKEDGAEVSLVRAGWARNDTVESRANAASEEARALGRECRFADAVAALARAQQLNLEHLADVRREVSKAKHHRYCVETSQRRIQRGPLEGDSPFMRHSLQQADEDIAQAQARDAEVTLHIGQLDALHRSMRARRNDVEAMRQNATRRLDGARQAAGDCDWARAATLLDTVHQETLECAVQLDAQRRARDELAMQVEQARTQISQLETEYAKIIATPFAQVNSCGEFSLVADTFDAIPGQCRVVAGIDAKVANLRERSRACSDARTNQMITQGGGTPTAQPTISIAGTWTSSAGWIYDIRQSGMSFTWTVTNQPQLNERGEGSITESGKINASWTNASYSGRADGTVFALDSNGRATRITWSNGILFQRE